MEDKQMIIDKFNFEEWLNHNNKLIQDLRERILGKEQELQEAMDNYVKLDNQRVKEYNKLVDKYNNKEQEVDILKEENEMLKRRITKIFACLINANRTDKIVDTLWVGGIMTLWDYIAQTLEIKGDQIEIEEQILQKISECEVNNG